MVLLKRTGCHKYIFVATNTYLSRQNTSFVTTKVRLPRQNFCCDKIFLSRQAYYCRDKRRVLSRQTRKTFVATKILLVAAPANDSVATP